MSFRYVVIKDRAKLDLRMNYLIIRNEDEKQIFIPEISVLILESTKISMTCALLSTLIDNNIKVIICDEKHNPKGELVGYNQNCSNVRRIQNQINWSADIKGLVWQQIIKEKIKKQALVLKDYQFKDKAEMLLDYHNNVEVADITNREGHSAKVYFNTLFGKDFQRRNESKVNNALNYGYIVLLATFNREVAKSGYLNQLGIWHKNEFNKFNLASDLIEPFRPVVDRIVLMMNDEELENYKYNIVEMVDLKFRIAGKELYLENAISLYCQSVFDSLNNQDISLLKFYE